MSAGSLSRDDGSWSMSGVIDRSIFEAFIDGGVDSLTNTFFATQPLTLMVLSANDLPEDVNVSVKVHALESAWKEEQSDDGLVRGNTTSTSSD